MAQIVIDGSLFLFGRIPRRGTNITGLAVAAIVAAAAIEITLIFAVYEGYDEVEVGKGQLVLRRKAEE
jgi:hypothetical protein